MTLEERLASVQFRMEGTLAEDQSGRVCFVQDDKVVKVWDDKPDAIERAVAYLEYSANRLGV